MAPANEKRLRDLPDQFLACRDLRHAWEPLGYFRERGSGRAGGPIILPSGMTAGSPEEALDCACGLYLSDPGVWRLDSSAG
jgi:hypothetical protein